MTNESRPSVNTTASENTTTAANVEPWLREILRCPVTHSELVDDVDASGSPVLVSTAIDESRGGRLQYPVRYGIPVLLADDATVLPA